MPTYLVTGYYTFKVMTKIEAEDEDSAMQQAADLWPDTDGEGVDLTEGYGESAELVEG